MSSFVSLGTPLLSAENCVIDVTTPAELMPQLHPFTRDPTVLSFSQTLEDAHEIVHEVDSETEEVFGAAGANFVGTSRMIRAPLSPTHDFAYRVGIRSPTRPLSPTHGFVLAEHSTFQQPRSSYMRSPTRPLSPTLGFIRPVAEHGTQQPRSSLMHPPSRPLSPTHGFISPVAQRSVVVSPMCSPLQPLSSRVPHVSVPESGTAVLTGGSGTNQTLFCPFSAHSH